MELDSDYWNALDEGRKLRVDPTQIGISHGVGDVGEGLKANVFRGARVVELGFMGGGKGSRSSPGGHTPESYGVRERMEMRELAKVNEMEVSTHASPNVGYAAGYAEGAFRPEEQQRVLHEIHRATEFAADVGGGGPVVMHLGEFQRPLFTVEKNEDGSPGFEHYPGEERRAPLYVVDDRTGRIQAIARDTPLAVPEPERKGLDPWKHPKRGEDGMILFSTKTIADLEKEAGRKDATEHIFGELIKKENELTLGEARRFTHEARRGEREERELKNVLDVLQERRKTYPDQAIYEAITAAEKYGLAPRTGSPDYKGFLRDPFKTLAEAHDNIKQLVESRQELAKSYSARAFEMQEQVKHMKPITEYGVQQSARVIADAALHALEVERAKKLKNPLYIAPENWTPELYGSHPDEYRNIIVQSRKAMEEKLVRQEGMARDEANKIAKEHIKGTFDIAHANFWKKYFKGDKKEFDAWLTKETDKLTKEGLIGHVHLSDNFGYFDEHLSPGEGNAPIQRFVEGLKKHGYLGTMIAEPGGQREGRYHQALTEGWKMLGSPIYRIDTTSQAWTDIESSYFGRAPQPPNFIVGDYAPSKDWTLWSEVPLE